MLECATYLTTATTKVDEMYFLFQRKSFGTKMTFLEAKQIQEMRMEMNFITI